MKIHNWEDLKPCQIDALIARHVLHRDILVVFRDGGLKIIDDDGNPTPHYSTHIAAAWRLVRDVVEAKRSIAIDYLAEDDCWRCLVQNDRKIPFRAVEATPERAICKALLLREGILA